VNIDEKIIELGNKVKSKEMTWRQVADTINAEFGENISSNAVRKRYNVRIRKVPESESNMNTRVDYNGEYETRYADGVIEAQKIVEYNKEIFGDKKKMLEYLGYNPNEWEFVFFTTSVWMQHTKEQTTKQLYAVKFKLKPLINNLSLDRAVEAAKEVFSKSITPYEFETTEHKDLNEDRLMEIPAIELHLGKYTEYEETGQDYSSEIAQQRFYHILDEILKSQEQEKCDTAVVMIGNDFFNTDTSTNTTTKGTPQMNDVRWKNLFMQGLEMYKNLFFTLREEFNHIDVRLCQGNHDVMSSFYLYIALSSYFANDDKIKFSENYREYQCYKFGDNAIFFGHGDNNFKRLLRSIPAEFYQEWGSSKYRELHLGHLHSEITVDDQSGMITRRIGSPSGTDAWHYGERYLGATQKHQLFIWDRYDGLKGIKYIAFDNKYQKDKVKKLTK
jgi:hypothetical protein